MSTTIDRLQIEIASSSGNAAKGIDDLAKSLAALKKSGTISVAVKNLNNLSDALNKLPNVHPASNALRTLANSIEKLKGVGSISGTVTSLGKLPGALKSLGTINLDKVAPKIREVVDAMAPLSTIKAGGLGTLVNGLARLDKVTESLSDETITAFTKKVELLTQKLGPLSEKMTSIKGGFAAINSASRSAGGGVSKLDEEVNTTTLNLANMITVIQGVVAALQPLITLLANSIGAAMEWDGIRYQFGNAFGDQADEYYQKITKITEALDINKQAFMENSAMATSMLAGFGVDKTDAREMGLGYTQLAYDIWAAYNNVYKSLDGADGAMAAVRSAIAGEVEPIRRAGFTIVDSQLAITAANHGLAYSTTEATEAQKSYLRYLTLVDQAQNKGVVGTYAREMETAEGLTRTFTQQLKSLAQAFGSLFIPILVKAMPYVQAFVELLTEAVHWLASLFGVEIQDIGDTWNDYSTGVGDAVTNTEGVTDSIKDATKAAKELKNASIGIDELNVISPPSASSGAGGAGGAGGGAGGGGWDGLGDISSLWDESIFDSVQQKVDDIKTKMKGIFDDWLPTLKVIGGALAGWSIASLLGQLGDALKLGDDFAGKITTIKKLAGSVIIVAIQFKLMGDAFEEFMGDEGSIMDYIEGLLIGAGSSYLLYKQWGKGGLAIGLGVTAAVSLKTVIDAGGITDAESATVAITGLASGIASLALAFKALSEAWEAVSKSGAVTGLVDFFKAAKQMAPDVGWLAALFPKLSSALAGLPGALQSVVPILSAAGPYVAIAAAVVAGIVLAFVDYDFTEIGHTIGEKIGSAIRGTIGAIGKAITSAWSWITKELEFEDFWDVLAFILFPPDWFMRVVGFIEEKMDNLKENINEFFSGFFEGLFEGLGIDFSWADKLKEFFDIEYLDIVEMIVNPTSIGKYIFEGFWKGVSHIPIVDKFVEWCEGIVESVKSFFGIHSPSTVFAEIGGNLIAGLLLPFKPNVIKDKLATLWENAKSWWNDQKEALKTYTPSIGNIASKLSSAWTAAKDWWNGKRSNLSTYTPSIGKIWEKLRGAWTSAKDWWNKSRSSLSYTPSIGSIKTKLSSAWTSAKNWWSKSKGSMSYTPSIGSIKDKIVSAWNSAKKWWSSNAKLSTKLNISVPKLTVNWGEVSALGKTFKYPKSFSVKFAADGGIFDQGSLVWAGEHGAEIVANAAGGKTGVMNVQQMQDAVYEGVYAAMSSVMRGGSEGGEQSINIYLDGRQITAAVEKRQRERGASIMGNEVYAY